MAPIDSSSTKDNPENPRNDSLFSKIYTAMLPKYISFPLDKTQ